jgi:DNA polymerase-1
MLSMMGLSHEEHATGVIFGFLREIQKLAEDFENPQFVFAWDSRKSFRRDVYPDYKKKPPQKEDPEMEDIIRSGKPQFSEIRTKVLPRLGFQNNFIQTGVEADDIIAWIAKDHAWEYEHTYIVTSDEDLFQLLHEKVSIYNPREKKIYAKDDFEKDKGISVSDWAWVKATAGCQSDNVKGIEGVGEKTAIKYLRAELGVSSKKYQDIKQFDPSFNFSLVKLPHEKSQSVTLVPDKLDFSVFEGLCMDYGFASLLKKENYNKWRSILKGVENGIN